MSSALLSMPKMLLAAAMMTTAVLTAVFIVGWKAGRAPLQTRLAEQDSAHTREKLRTFEQAAQALQTAQDRGDALTNTLAQRQASIDQLTREKRHAVSTVTTGRACLDGPALRLLNGAPGLRVAGLPPATSGAAAADAPIATDTDITGWSIDAGAKYETCRARLDALIDWHATPTLTTPTPPDAHP